MKRLFWNSFALAAIVATLWPGSCFAQYVNDTAFCTKVVNKQCVGLLPSGADVPISALAEVNGHRTIYYWANVSASRSRAVDLYMLRNGSCYNDEVKISGRKLRSEPSKFSTFKAYVTSGRLMSDLLDAFSAEKGGAMLGAEAGAGPAKVDASINAVLVPGVNEYRVWHYRYVLCPGTIEARILDSAGTPFPGNNEIRVVKLH